MLQSMLRALASASILIGASLPVYAEVPFQVGDEPPPWLGVSPDGEEIRLTDHADQVRVVAFWASWCAPCLTELDALKAFDEDIPSNDLGVFAVNVHEIDQTKAGKIRRNYDDSGWVFSADRGRKIVTEHDITTIPLMLMIDHNGQLRHVHEGYEEEKRDQLVDELNTLLAEQARHRRADEGLSSN